MSENEPLKIGRREALKRMATVAAVPAVGLPALGQTPSAPASTRTLTDPDLIKPAIPAWPLNLSKEELRTVSALCDMIIPEDDQSPSASAVGVPEFINEWVSAPYPIQEADKIQIRGGLVWLDGEAQRRFEKGFADLNEDQKRQICDDICFIPKARPEHMVGARLFARMRDLAATGFYTTKEGMKDLKYIGNMALPKFDGPPPKVLEYLGVNEKGE